MNASALVSFLQELADNNNKAWFDAHRSQYQALRQEFTDLVGAVIAGDRRGGRGCAGVGSGEVYVSHQPRRALFA